MYLIHVIIKKNYIIRSLGLGFPIYEFATVDIS